jgi:hypothetical protein
MGYAQGIKDKNMLDELSAVMIASDFKKAFGGEN